MKKVKKVIANIHWKENAKMFRKFDNNVNRNLESLKNFLKRNRRIERRMEEVNRKKEWK